MTLVATLVEFKDWLKYKTAGSANDAKLTMALTSASSWVEWRQSGPMSVTAFTERLQASGCFLKQRKHPLVTVTSVTPQDGSALPSSVYIVDTTNSFIQLRYNAHGGWFTVVYTAGLAVISDRVKLAGLEVARHLWLIENGSSQRGYPDDDTIPTPMGFAVPRRADELMSADPDGRSEIGFA